MNNSEKLIQLIKEYPHLPIIPMVSSNIIGADDNCLYMCKWGKVEVDKYYCNDDRVYFYGHDLDDLTEKIIEDNFEDWEKEGKTIEEQDKLAEETAESRDWIDCIRVDIFTM